MIGYPIFGNALWAVGMCWLGRPYSSLVFVGNECYTEVQPLGKGAFATVYRAKLNAGRSVKDKVIKVQLVPQHSSSTHAQSLAHELHSGCRRM